jgi:hypothetical protein
MFRIQHHGVSGIWRDYRTVATIEEAAQTCRGLKADGYGVQVWLADGRRLWCAPWQHDFNPDMAVSRAWAAFSGKSQTVTLPPDTHPGWTKLEAAIEQGERWDGLA